MVFGGIWGQLFPKLFPPCIEREDERTDCPEGAAPRIERPKLGKRLFYH